MEYFCHYFGDPETCRIAAITAEVIVGVSAIVLGLTYLTDKLTQKKVRRDTSDTTDTIDTPKTQKAPSRNKTGMMPTSTLPGARMPRRDDIEAQNKQDRWEDK